MDVHVLVNNDASRLEAFRGLSECYFLPDSGLSATVACLARSMAIACAPAAGHVQRMYRECKDGAGLEPLKIDFAKLFVGPYTLLAPPYGSVYLEDAGRTMGDSTLDVKKRYRDAGLVMARGYKDAPDHIAVELEFMSYLIFKEMNAFSQTDTTAAMDTIRSRKAFLDHHLMAWAPAFIEKIIEHAQTTFYQHLATATRLFLEDNYRDVCSVLASGQLNATAPRGADRVGGDDGIFAQKP